MNQEIKIIVLSDIHRNVSLMETILSQQKHDYVIVAGDFECSDQIIQRNNINFCVRGNNDFFSSYPDHINFEIEGLRFHLEHGHLSGSYAQLDNYDFMHQALLREKCDFFIYGHTHIPRIFQYPEGYAINPGSITLPRGGSTPSYVIITITKNKEITTKLVQI